MPGHPRLSFTKKETKDVDARDEPGHDGVDRSERNISILVLRHRLFDQFLGGFRQQFVGGFAINRFAADFQHHRHGER